MAEAYKWIFESLTASRNEATIYAPPSGFNAQLFDFFITSTLTSCAELPNIQSPNGLGLMNETEKNNAWLDATASADKKIVRIEYVNAGGTIVKASEFLIYRVTPSYTENLTPYLTSKAALFVPKGCSIKASIVAYNCGILQGTDAVSFRMCAYEFTDTKSIDDLITQYLV